MAQATPSSTTHRQKLSPDVRHVVISANPNSGAESGIEQAQRLRELLNAMEFPASVETDLDRVIGAVERLKRQGDLRTVVAAGGDGTAALIANSIDPSIPITLLPLGTENLLARHFKITSAPGKVAEIIAEGRVCSSDAGLANGKLFLLHATVGFDAEVVRRLHKRRRGHINHFSYAVPIFSSIRLYKYPQLTIHTHRDARKPIRSRWAFVFNHPCYAMGLPIIPDADGTDGQLDLCTFRGGRLLNGLRYLFGVLTRRHRSWRDTHFERTTWMRIEAEEPVPYQLDGDPGGELPLEIEVLPGRIRLLVPG